MKLFIFALLGFIHHAKSHSWLACTDYMEKNGAYWSPDKCRGFPRNSETFAPKNSFGLDRGFDHRSRDGTAACKTSYSSNSYNNEYPKAIYYPGQQVILAHPMKNHGADVCTNQYIPDTANKIYRGKRNTDRDRNLGYYRNVLVADLGVSPVGYNAGSVYTTYPKPGYQNAPKFCENTDKSMGTYAFNVPSNLAAGEYTFVWRWSFNGEGDIYTTCFDVIVAQNKAARDVMLNGQGMGLYVACGGITSDGKTSGSSVGCSGSVVPTSLPTTRPTTTTTRRTTRRTTTTTRPNTPGFTTTKRAQAPTTTTTTTRSTTTTPPPERNAIVKMNQVSGVVELEQAERGAHVRYVSVQFPCPVHASFWNARLLGHENMFYDLVQEQSDHISSNKIYFTATFVESCDLGSKPIYAVDIVDS